MNKRPWIENCSQYHAERFIPPENTVCVSITMPSQENMPVLSTLYKDILKIEFIDFDPSGPGIDVESAIKYEPECIQKEHANTIAEFVSKHRGSNIVVHCMAGKHRSRGVVEAVLCAFPEYEDTTPVGPKFPNNRVLTMVKRALGVVPMGVEHGG